MAGTREVVGAVVGGALRVPGLARAAVTPAGGRGHGLTLIWHRIGPQGPAAHEVVRTVDLRAFEAQLDVLVQLGDIVPLRAFAEPPTGKRPRFALTFDDDDPGHTRWTLPVLRARGLPATFFLSGRWRDEVGPYWWEVLESRIEREGVARVAAELDLPTDLEPPKLAAMLFGSEQARDLARDASGRAAPMTVDEAKELVDAGAEIGFHTRDHDVLPSLTDAALAAALRHGRETVEDDLGVGLERFAYPHGMADERVATATATEGYVGAWTTTKIVAQADTPPMLQGRWDLGHEPVDRFRTRIVHALTRRPAHRSVSTSQVGDPRVESRGG